ncbi:uncharacterized protein LOC129288018 [Prosopis cineraria]|uniref:uncharacterized protein LOC129288018 n=1 Tax=Prosopis cineraria TaxID=364024 RepID=UPI00240F44A1|nr:uncharacterized protein LOC129288018 [Prosopis cineraria]
MVEALICAQNWLSPSTAKLKGVDVDNFNNIEQAVEGKEFEVIENMGRIQVLFKWKQYEDKMVRGMNRSSGHYQFAIWKLKSQLVVQMTHGKYSDAWAFLLSLSSPPKKPIQITI